MASVLLIFSNKKEQLILNTLLERLSIETVISNPGNTNYIKALQYNPNMIICDIPALFKERAKFIALVKRNKRTAGVFIIAIGNHHDKAVVTIFKKCGVNSYMLRPVKSQIFMNTVITAMPKEIQVQAQAEAQVVNAKKDEIKLLLDKSVKPVKKIDIMVNHISKLMAFPFTIAKVLEITRDKMSGANELAKAIRLDPVIATTILKTSNSVFFASINREISDVKEAIVRIGFRETQSIVLSLSVMQLFSKNNNNLGFDRTEFWYHSLCVAVIAERLARTAGLQNSEEAFLAGLLHDFGIILLDEFFSEIFVKIMEKTTNHGTLFSKEEKGILGITHINFTERLFQLWKIPESIIFCIRHQENFLATDKFKKKDIRPQIILMMECVGLANVVSKSMQLGKDVDMMCAPVPNPILEKMKYPAGLRETFFDHIYAQLNMFNEFLRLDKNKFPMQRTQIKDADKIKIAFIDLNFFAFNPFLSYLLSQGYTVLRVKTREELDEKEFAPDIVFFHIKTEMLPEKLESSLEPFLKIPRPLLDEVSEPSEENKEEDQKEKEKAEKEVSQEPEGYVPIVLIHSTEQIPQKLDQWKNITFLAEKIDMRKVDKTIASALLRWDMLGGSSDQELMIDESIWKPEIRVLELSGTVGATTINKLRDYLVEILNTKPEYVVIYVEYMDFIDSTGLGLFANMFKRIDTYGGKMCFYRPNNVVNGIIENTNMNKLIAIIQQKKEIYTTFGLEWSGEDDDVSLDIDIEDEEEVAEEKDTDSPPQDQVSEDNEPSPPAEEPSQVPPPEVVA